MESYPLIYVNAKYKQQKVTGVQRYAKEIVKSWRDKNFEFQELEVSKRYPNISEQLLLRSNNDLLWCPTNSGPIVNKNKVVTLHDCVVFFEPSWFSKHYATFRKIIIPKLIESSRGIIIVSNFLKSIIIEKLKVDGELVKLIPNGIDHNYFNLTQTVKRRELLSKYFINKPYFLIVGSLDPRKNIAFTLKAWSKLPNYIISNFDLVIVGCHNSNFRKIVHSEIADLESIRYLGYVHDEDLRELYANAHAFLFPSLFEGVGLPVLEAMAMQVPVICSSFVALPEVCGNAVRYINPTELDDLIEAIIEIATNEALCRNLAKLGVIRSKRYSWEFTALETYNYLKDCIQ